jgi:hypothetical protein
MLRAVCSMEASPRFDFDIDAVPVDSVSAAIVSLVAEAPDPAPRLLHLNSSAPLAWERVAEVFSQAGAPIRPLPYDEWLARAKDDQFQRPDAELYPFRTLFSNGHDGLSIPQLYRRSLRPTIHNAGTRELLRGLGLSIPDPETLLRDTYAPMFAKSL